jgi:hypothetical protein
MAQMYSWRVWATTGCEISFDQFSGFVEQELAAPLTHHTFCNFFLKGSVGESPTYFFPLLLKKKYIAHELCIQGACKAQNKKQSTC